MQVKVWNDNTIKWEETFKDAKIIIPAKGSIEMEFYEAHEFKGQYFPPTMRGDGTQDPKTFKMIRIEVPPQTEDEDEGMELFSCHSCRKVFTTEALLTKHSESEHSHQMVVDPAAEKEAKQKKSSYSYSKFEEA